MSDTSDGDSVDDTPDEPADDALSITADGLTRRFGDVTAVDDLDLELDGPQIVGVVGPNGAGKTTFVRCLLGLLRPTSGATSVFGTPSTRLDATERARIGYMPQGSATYSNLTVRANVEFFAQLYRITDRAAAVERALSFVDLVDRADSTVASLSGGLVRRTSLACAVVHDPDVLVLDEPTVGVDPKLRAEMWDAFRDRRDDGALTLVSTHYLGEATRCDRVLFLRDGRVLAFDAPETFLDSTGTDDLEDAFLALLERAENRGESASSVERASTDSAGSVRWEGTR